MNKRFWNADKILSFSALLISLLTLSVFIYQTNLIRQQQYLSVYPHLALSNTGGKTLNYTFELSNEGIGPALIKEIKITAGNGKSYDDIADYVGDIVEEKDSVQYLHGSLDVGRLLPAKETIPLINLVTKEEAQEMGYAPNTLASSWKLYIILNDPQLSIEITYESIYGESWTITNNSDIPIKN